MSSPNIHTTCTNIGQAKHFHFIKMIQQWPRSVLFILHKKVSKETRSLDKCFRYFENKIIVNEKFSCVLNF